MEVIYRGYGEEWVLGKLALRSDKRQCFFEYTQQAIEHGIEFSPLQLPLSTETFSNFEYYQEWLPRFIADSLPDGWGRLLMDRLLRRNNIDPASISVLDRLALLGESTMGAFVYRPSLPIPGEQGKTYNLQNLTQLAQQVHIEVIGKDSDVLSELVRLGGSPHGARPKAVIEYMICPHFNGELF